MISFFKAIFTMNFFISFQNPSNLVHALSLMKPVMISLVSLFNIVSAEEPPSILHLAVDDQRSGSFEAFLKPMGK